MTDNYGSEYTCGNCGASGCKLWREYQAFTPALRCAVCAAAEQDKDISSIDAQGMRLRGEGVPTNFPRTDQIGWYIPAVQPEGDPDYYWGYTSCPVEDYERWQALPTLPC